MTAIQDRLMALKQRTEQMSEVKVWKPVAGEAIAGTNIGSGSFTHPLYGEQQTILLDTGAGVFSIILSKYLKNALTTQGALHGDLVAIKFLGRGQGKNGVFNRYSVTTERN
jgi:hypothetical protein